MRKVVDVDAGSRSQPNDPPMRKHVARIPLTRRAVLPLICLVIIGTVDGGQASAAVTIGFRTSPEPVAQGGVVSVDVIATAEPAGETFSEFNLAVDVGPPMSGFPDGITFSGGSTPFPTAAGIGSFYAVATPGIPFFDLFGEYQGETATPLPYLISTSALAPTTLFSFDLEIAEWTEPGQYTLALFPGSAMSTTVAGEPSPVNLIGNPGSFTVQATAVPEPATVALLAVGFGGVVARSAYRKRKERLSSGEPAAV